MLRIKYTARMKHDMKRMQKRGKDMRLLEIILSLLVEQKTLPDKYKDHMLSGRFQGLRECHVEPDWLLLYQVVEDELRLTATATGSHADIFKM